MAEIHLINRENIPWLEEQMISEKRWVKKWNWDNCIIELYPVTQVNVHFTIIINPRNFKC